MYLHGTYMHANKYTKHCKKVIFHFFEILPRLSPVLLPQRPLHLTPLTPSQQACRLPVPARGVIKTVCNSFTVLQNFNQILDKKISKIFSFFFHSEMGWTGNLWSKINSLCKSVITKS